MFRLLVGMLLITLPSILISPPSMELKPMIIRSRVVLPQPDGPKRVKNSPGLTSRDRPLMMVSLPNRLITFSMLIATLMVG